MCFEELSECYTGSMNTPSSSSRFQINVTDVYKAIRGALIVFLAAFVMGGLESVNGGIADGSLELGQFELVRPVLVSFVSFLLETTRRYFTAYS